MSEVAADPSIATIEDEREPGQGSSNRPHRGWWVAAACWSVVAGCGLVVLDHLGRGTTFFYDEWNFVLERRSGWGDALWAPHNGHLSVLPILAYRVLLATVGLDDYHPYRLMGLAVHFAVATLVVVLVGKRIAPLVGVAAGSIVLLLGVGWQNIFWPFQIGFMGSVACFLAAWLLLDAKTRRNDVLAAAFLVAALGCSGLGIAVVVGCAVRLALRRSTWHRWWVVAVPTALYLVWYLLYGVSQASSSNITDIPSYVWSSLGGASGALAGRGIGIGQIVGLAVAALVAWRLVREPLLRPETLGAIAVVGFNWVLTAVARGSAGEPAASRYMYVGAVFIIVVIAEAAHGVRVPTTAQVGAVGLAALCVWGNWHAVQAGSAGLRQVSVAVRAELAALEWATDGVDPAMHPDVVRMPSLTAGPYLDAVESLGSPAASPAEVEALPEEIRELVDRLSLDIARFRVERDPRPAVGPPPVLLSSGGVASGSCVYLRPDVDDPPELDLGPNGVVVVADREQRMSLTRFADRAASGSAVTAPAGTPVAVVVAPDDIARPWRLTLDLTAPVKVCSRA